MSLREMPSRPAPPLANQPDVRTRSHRSTWIDLFVTGPIIVFVLVAMYLLVASRGDVQALVNLWQRFVSLFIE